MSTRLFSFTKSNIFGGLNFIDLFAGLGGFHLALSELGHDCVFASELNDDLRELYKRNFPEVRNENVRGNIHDVNVEEIPPFDILCAGFPCQPFSQAGKRQGLSDPNNGNHFNKIIEILRFHKPKYLLLENVQNLKNHDNGRTWQVIKELLEANDMGYEVKDSIISPHQFGVPQHRKRIYIVGKLGGLNGFKFPVSSHSGGTSIDTVIDTNPDISTYSVISSKTKLQLEVWQEFLDNIKNIKDVPRFPIWAAEFGATYPFEEQATTNFQIDKLNKFKGSFGHPIAGDSIADLSNYLPQYALTKQLKFPSWKIKYIRSNREFYEKNKKWLKPWVKKLKTFKHSHQKFEWNCGYVPLNLKGNIIQFRPSGIRVKKPDFSPALVLSSTQIPIIFDEELDDFRHMSISEAAGLQSMQNLCNYPFGSIKAFKAFGNAVNVKVVKEVAKEILE
jgi:DNA (cytosine-5)-methyltransferase 1